MKRGTERNQMKLKIKFIYWENTKGEIVNLWNTDENKWVLIKNL